MVNDQSRSGPAEFVLLETWRPGKWRGRKADVQDVNRKTGATVQLKAESRVSAFLLPGFYGLCSRLIPFWNSRRIRWNYSVDRIVDNLNDNAVYASRFFLERYPLDDGVQTW